MTVRRLALLRATFLAFAVAACIDGSPAGPPPETPLADEAAVPSVVEVARIEAMLGDPFMVGLIENLNEPAAAQRLIPAIQSLSERLRATEFALIPDALVDARAAAEEYARQPGISDDDHLVLAALEYVLGRADELLAETALRGRTAPAR